VQIVAIFPNGSFKSTIEFIEKYLLEYLIEYQQFGFVKQLPELKVGTRPAGKAYRTRIILFSATNISSISQLIDVLEEERQIHQLHLLLLSEDTSRLLQPRAIGRPEDAMKLEEWSLVGT
jgi:hypothetical protein